MRSRGPAIARRDKIEKTHAARLIKRAYFSRPIRAADGIFNIAKWVTRCERAANGNRKRATAISSRRNGAQLAVRAHNARHYID